MPELIKADPQETVPLEEFLPVKSLIYVFAPALEFKYAIVNLCVLSSLPPPDANPVAGVKRAGTAGLVGGVDTEGEECTNSSWCKISWGLRSSGIEQT